MSKQAPTTDLHPLLTHRYSTRSYQDRPVEAGVLLRLFEAARWSPSCYNEQPWRFVVASRVLHPEGFEKIASTIVSGNAWALQAPVLGISIANLQFSRNGNPNRWAQYDTGQAIAHLTFQAQQEGLSIHQMGGFDAAKAMEVLRIPEGHEAMAAFTIGYPVETLPPSERSRRSLDSILFGGAFGAKF